MAHETNLNHAFYFLDYIQSDGGMPYSIKPTQQRAVRQDIQ